MINRVKPLLNFFIIFFCARAFSQDTLITANDHRFKAGIKFNFEKSAEYYYEDNHSGNNIICFGFQIIRNIKKTKSSFESGIYFTTKIKQYHARYININSPLPAYYDGFTLAVYHHYLTVPINYRLDTKSIYVAAGLFGDINLYQDARLSANYIDIIERYGTDRKFQLGWNINFGMEKPVSYRADLFVEARFAVTVSALKKEEGGFFLTSGSIGSSNTNYGIGIGANYKLNRGKIK